MTLKYTCARVVAQQCRMTMRRFVFGVLVVCGIGCAATEPNGPACAVETTTCDALTSAPLLEVLGATASVQFRLADSVRADGGRDVFVVANNAGTELLTLTFRGGGCDVPYAVGYWPNATAVARPTLQFPEPIPPDVVCTDIGRNHVRVQPGGSARVGSAGERLILPPRASLANLRAVVRLPDRLIVLGPPR